MTIGRIIEIILLVGGASYYAWYLIFHGKDGVGKTPEELRRFKIASYWMIAIAIYAFIKNILLN